MNRFCPACLRVIETHEPSTMISARGKPLFRVHSGRCAEAVSTATVAVGSTLIKRARATLAQRAPVVSSIVETFAALRRGDRKDPPHGNRI